MKKVIVVFAAFMAIASIAEANNPKSNDTKAPEAAPSATEAKTTGPTLMWFHFNGDASDPAQVADASNYSPETTPQCPTSTPAYRCDIRILSNNDQTEPDLSQTVQAERKRDNAE